MTVVKEPDQNTAQSISKQCIYLRSTCVHLLVNMKYVICVQTIKVTLDTQLTWKDGLWYGALISSKHKISAELLTDVPFTGAELTLIQAQEVSSLCFSFGLKEGLTNSLTKYNHVN